MIKQMTNAYVRHSEEILPKSSLHKDCIRAFAVGGAICCLGQLLSDLYSMIPSLTEETVKCLVPSTLVFLGAFLTGTGVYDDIGKFAGAGSVVPITGFSNSVVSCALEYKREGFVFGIGAKMFTIAGPVLVYGITASVLAGLIYYLSGI